MTPSEAGSPSLGPVHPPSRPVLRLLALVLFAASSPLAAAQQTFTVTVEFSSGGEPYATETYTVEATDWYRAQRDAIEMSVSSPYDNARIPEITRRVIAH